MMNNAYQNLQGLVTSFTRSAAGAEKVFSLWDSTPDIDPDSGAEIDWNVEGEIDFKVRIDEKRSDELTTLALGAKDAPPPQILL